jgi:hypothetical protein
MIATYAQMIFGYMMYTLSPYLMVFINASLQYIGIRQYTIDGDTTQYRKICKHLEGAMNTNFIYRNQQLIKAGYFISLDCVGLYNNQSRYTDENSITLFCTPAYFTKITAEESRIHVPTLPTKGPVSNQVKKYTRTGSFKNFYYVPLTIDVTAEPIGEQGPIIDSILDLYNKQGRATVFIHGVTGAGKSTIGYLIAKALNGNYCNTFKPTDPGDSFANLLSEIQNRSTSEKPLIIMLDEVNSMIHAIHDKKIVNCRDMPVPISDKVDWVNMFDDLVFFKNIILIMTSNESKEEIDALDPAYLRTGRIDKCVSMVKPIEITI